MEGASAIFEVEAGRDASLPVQELIRPAEVVVRQLDAILLDRYGHTLDEPGRRNLMRLITTMLAGYTAVVTQATRTAADALNLDPLAVLTAVEKHLDAAGEQFDGDREIPAGGRPRRPRSPATGLVSTSRLLVCASRQSRWPRLQLAGGNQRGRRARLGRMPVLIRLRVGRMEARTLRLPDLPRVGELIELSDHTRVVVRTIERTPDDFVEAEVRATRTRWKPTIHLQIPRGAPPRRDGAGI
jgi:hypothetical protein